MGPFQGINSALFVPISKRYRGPTPNKNNNNQQTNNNTVAASIRDFLGMRHHYDHAQWSVNLKS